MQFSWRHIGIIFVIAAGIGLSIGLLWRWLQTDSSPPITVTEAQQLATVNGVTITQEMVDRELKISRLNVADPLPPLSGTDLEQARDEALNQLITRQIILQAAHRQEFILDDDFIESRADLLFGTYGDEVLTEALTLANATHTDLLWWIEEIFTVEEFTTQVIMVEAAPEDRQEVYNEWLNTQRAQAQITTYLDGKAQTSRILLAGNPAPNFTLTTLDGQPTTLSDYTGKVVLINFWATWCPSCVTEMPDYEQVFQQKKPNFVVLGINLQEGEAHVQQYATGLGLTFPVLLDSDGNVTTRQYQVTGMPGSFIIDRDGNIFYRHIGPMSVETLTAKLAELGL